MRPDDTAPEGAVCIPLRARNGVVLAYAVVDAADAERVNRWRWNLAPSGYAQRGGFFGGKQRNFLLHRQLLGLIPCDGSLVDHINRDKLDNRRANLRLVTAAQNSQNRSSLAGSTSKFVGVWWDKARNRWCAQLRRGDKAIWIGRFESEEEAGTAVMQAQDRLGRGVAS